MESAIRNGVCGRKVLVTGEGAVVCFLCEKSFPSMKYLYGHISSDYHSDSEWKTYLAYTINVSGQRKNLEANKVVDISTKDIFGWKVVTGKRGRPGLNVAKDGVKVDDELQEAAEGLLLLARGHSAPSKEVEPARTDEIQDLTAGVVHDHPSMAEPEPTVVPQTLIQAADADFKGGYMVVHDFDMIKL